ncbi:galactosylceramide sulfotransferase-like [Amphiura filiformis]|uniref:galactosylceramide sulfotransferase-like n=1 Tax=Amphiura filiformis TaxID=82378 RepID=UPI003B22494C
MKNMNKRFALIIAFTTALGFTTLYYPIGSLQTYKERSSVLSPSPPHRDSKNRTNDSLNGTCRPHDQLVFVKTHKTGSTTLQLIIQIYGYYRNSSFVFNRGNERFGHIHYGNLKIDRLLPPVNVEKYAYNEYKSNFDISTGHLVYQRTLLDIVMKNSSKFISLLRDPVHQFESAFVYFGHTKKGNGSTEVQIIKWLDAAKHDDRFLNNNQMLDLGLPAKDFRNQSAVALHIKKLSREIDLVLITEYFDESLLLLRKLMCWSFDDILYLKQKVRSSRSQPLSESTKDKIRTWNEADTSLYEYFNETLWEKIKSYGPRFQHDLQYFKLKQTKLFNSCIGNATSEIVMAPALKIPRLMIKYNTLSNTTDYCTLMANRQSDTFKRLWARQDN